MEKEFDLEGAGLHGADLREALLVGADLSEADLCESLLAGPDLRIELDRLLVAAVVSKQFCHTLLTNRPQAIVAGYGDDKFNFSATERQLLFSIKARTLEEFAQKLITLLRVA